ncbi:RNA 2',3'-cyclic phosphodiesterase [Nocardiopsis gilva YIM 90087]|uniref:RNA 2',3'-cyclic phosphodiesterase n=1 Tax=Nocardiopsis gilva YIM 90087 TaxID=1235441 RepID=A0A223S2L2_9ACTN|nr:RNA 2',3'-cyclic phosphodiesterase [Nocardiopsis gilva]ASU82259.1 RNA 2',3'-cyclic phosphodiesterase [Nocardiopsis gilva YIM 90087]
MRLFLAIDPPDDLLERVEEAASALRADGDGLRWSHPEDWHLTLVFLGEVDDGLRTLLEKRFAAEIHHHPPLSLAVRGAGTFPGDETRARVLWAGFEGDIGALGRLAADLRRVARKSGVPIERRPYVPHLTLARSRIPADVSGHRSVLRSLATPFWTADTVRLLQSIPGGSPRYRTVATWPLG